MAGIGQHRRFATRARRGVVSLAAVAALMTSGLLLVAAAPAGATNVANETDLRAAFSDVNETSIILTADIALTCTGTNELQRSSTTAVTIEGQGHTITQTCANSRVIHNLLIGKLTLSNLKITGGSGPAGQQGGGILAELSDVALVNSSVVGNFAIIVGGIDMTSAGAQTLTMTNSTVSGNNAFGAGGISMSGSGSANLTNSTVSGNDGTSSVGGINAFNVNLVYSTVAGNTSGQKSNITAGTLTTFASVITEHGAADNCLLSGTPPATTSNGYNYSDDTTCGLTDTTDSQALTNDAKLNALGNNGGHTQTRMPALDSPLTEAIPVSACTNDGASTLEPLTDQRGNLRPEGIGCDIGSVESPAGTFTSLPGGRFGSSTAASTWASTGRSRRSRPATSTSRPCPTTCPTTPMP